MSKTVFPLVEAYPFGVQKGLAKEIQAIKDLHTRPWHKKYASSIRRGYMIELFEAHGILDEFLRAFWPLGKTQSGKTKIKRFIRIKDEYLAAVKGMTAKTKQFILKIEEDWVLPKSDHDDSLISQFRKVLDSFEKLHELYNQWITSLIDEPLWSMETPDCRRIPWYLANEAREILRKDFSTPGLYLFGVKSKIMMYKDREIPIYIGKTQKTLKERLFKRYVGNNPMSQCQLSSTYEKDICKKGIDGFPEEIRVKRSKVRLRHAVEFAKHGPEGIWFTLLPVSKGDVNLIKLEKRLIFVANLWNKNKGYPELLNTQHT